MMIGTQDKIKTLVTTFKAQLRAELVVVVPVINEYEVKGAAVKLRDFVLVGSVVIPRC